MTDRSHTRASVDRPARSRPREKPSSSGGYGARFLNAVRTRLTAGKQIRRTLPDGGRLHIDRELPFLCVYRRPNGGSDTGTSRLITGEASYLIAPGGEEWLPAVRELVSTIAETLTREFGAFLVLEIWAKPDAVAEADHRALDVEPEFELLAPGANAIDGTVEVLVRHLKRIRVQKQSCRVNVERVRTGIAPPDLPPLYAPEQNDDGIPSTSACSVFGLAVPPVYRDERHDPSQEFPLLLKTFRRRLGLALRRGFYDFTKRMTVHRPPHYHELGRRAVVKAVWQVDEQLAEVSKQFDYLLSLTPINAAAAWESFRDRDYQQRPEFHYLPLPFDPALLKRQLYRTPIERIEDPALASLFVGKQEELDAKITMLGDRNTRRFRYGSQRLFGPVNDELLAEAKAILDEITVSEPPEARERVGAEEFARRAREEIALYHARAPEFTAEVVVTDKVPGIMVSRGRLLVGRGIEVGTGRVDALIQHEVGTHMVTFHNGSAQPFKQLKSGLATYEQLQEGLAVLAEYLVGGLSKTRLRQLAGRVVAVRHLEDGADFVDNFRELVEEYGFRPRSAFSIVMRVHRGGGLTKDAVYLRGLTQLLELLQTDVDLDLLFIGKMAVDHLGLLRELRHRGVLEGPRLRPLYLERDDVAARLAELRSRPVSLSEIARSAT